MPSGSLRNSIASFAAFVLTPPQAPFVASKRVIFCAVLPYFQWRSRKRRWLPPIFWTRQGAEPIVRMPGHTVQVLRVEGLGKRYGNRWLFRNLNFELSRGDVLVVVGANGSGKSTLLRIIAGLTTPSEGQTHLPEGDPRRCVGVSAIELNLYPNLTVSEHLSLAGSLRGAPARESELLSLVGLAHASDLRIAQISTGMKARLKLALAVQPEPELLILDEPGAGLDAAGVEIVAQLVDMQKTRGCVLLATNDQQERRLASLELELAS
jgi:heme exporter protein A